MKVCVYAICKNEEKFIPRWVESMSEADEIYVLDTGSEDNSVELLQKAGVKVFKKEIKPWRFDSARNVALELLPMDIDICVSTDIDEVFVSGWRKEVECAWKKNTTRLKYKYVWSFNSDGTDGVVYYLDKIHSRLGYKWINAVHEVLYSENEVFSVAENVRLEHHPDKTKSRGQYLELLEISVKEDPENDRNVHYLAREYMYNSRFKEAIKTFLTHLSLKNATWKDERAASMRYIARCYANLGNVSEAYKYYLLAITEAPHLRETWLDAAYFEYYRENYVGTIYFIEYALNIKERSMNYINEANSWGAMPYDVLSIAYYKIGDIEKAKENVKKAIKLSDEKRLRDNLYIYEKAN